MKERDILTNYLPADAVEQVMDWIVHNNVHLKITKSRTTKLGDYRPPSAKNRNHRISINHNLNKYNFLITFIHELAHLYIWQKHKNSVLPHGKEWKNEYRLLVQSMLDINVFPQEIADVLKKSIINSKASSSSDINLSRVLGKYDDNADVIHLEDIPEASKFITNTGRVFIKGKKRRTRYVCINDKNNMQYLFHPLTPVNLYDK